MTIKNTDQRVKKSRFDDNYDSINWKTSKKKEGKAALLCPVCTGEIEDNRCSTCGWRK